MRVRRTIRLGRARGVDARPRRVAGRRRRELCPARANRREDETHRRRRQSVASSRVLAKHKTRCARVAVEKVRRSRRRHRRRRRRDRNRNRARRRLEPKSPTPTPTSRTPPPPAPARPTTSSPVTPHRGRSNASTARRENSPRRRARSSKWTTGAVDAPLDFVSAFAFTADVDATSTKLALADEWFDVTDAGDIVLALTPSDVLAAEKRD